MSQRVLFLVATCNCASNLLTSLSVYLLRHALRRLRACHPTACVEAVYMRIVNPQTGKTYFRKLRKRIEELGDARELTFSCYRRFKFLTRERTCQWFINSLIEARDEFAVDLWAYVIMPEHVHLLIYPREEAVQVGRVAGSIKESVARPAIQFLQQNAPQWIPRITVHEGKRIRRRFWQPGGGYDRNVVKLSTVEKMIDYIHSNPVRRGLVGRPEDWPWSSAGWYAGVRPVPIEMDATIPTAYVIQFAHSYQREMPTH